MRRFPLLVLALAALAAGCGEDIEDRPANRDAPGLTVGDRSYESGGADGSGADGTEAANPRGGIAASPDSEGGLGPQEPDVEGGS